MWGSGTLDNKQLFIFIININKGHNCNYNKGYYIAVILIKAIT
jgi:hypothetical protein